MGTRWRLSSWFCIEFLSAPLLLWIAILHWWSTEVYEMGSPGSATRLLWFSFIWRLRRYALRPKILTLLKYLKSNIQQLTGAHDEVSTLKEKCSQITARLSLYWYLEPVGESVKHASPAGPGPGSAGLHLPGWTSEDLACRNSPDT